MHATEPIVGFTFQGSKAQLEEVWNEEDGLEEQEFEPRTFFQLHGEAAWMVAWEQQHARCQTLKAI